MRSFCLKFFVAIFFAILIGCNASGNEEQQTEEAREPADYVEQASFTTLEGDSVHISDYEGKVVLIDFWETWCKPCLASFPGIDSLKTKYPDQLEVLAVTPGFTDTKANAKEFAANHDYDFTYLMDSNGLHQKLNVVGIPYKIYIDPEGNFIESSLGSAGPEGDYKKIEQIIEKYNSDSTNTAQ